MDLSVKEEEEMKYMWSKLRKRAEEKLEKGQVVVEDQEEEEEEKEVGV